MGLDVTAFKRIRKLDVPLDDDGIPLDPKTGKWLEDCYQCYINPAFPEHAKGLEHRAVYSFEDSLYVRAGSYSGYNYWRELLAELAGYEAVPYEGFGGETRMGRYMGARAAGSGPFYEMIWFSDCEGSMDATTAAKLAKDFQEWDERAKAFGDARDPHYFYSLYAQLRAAFELAADDGAIEFC